MLINIVQANPFGQRFPAQRSAGVAVNVIHLKDNFHINIGFKSVILLSADDPFKCKNRKSSRGINKITILIIYLE